MSGVCHSGGRSHAPSVLLPYGGGHPEMWSGQQRASFWKVATREQRLSAAEALLPHEPCESLLGRRVTPVSVCVSAIYQLVGGWDDNIPTSVDHGPEIGEAAWLAGVSTIVVERTATDDVIAEPT